MDSAHKEHRLCPGCRRNITNIVRIKCAECADDVQLCLDCFASGKEMNLHRKFHKYRVLDAINVPIYTEDWTGDEELLLLEGIELFGMGNWADIGEHIGNKTAAECEKHYFGVYIDVPTKPLPYIPAKHKHLPKVEPPQHPLQQPYVPLKPEEYEAAVKAAEDAGLCMDVPNSVTTPKEKLKDPKWAHRIDPTIGKEIGFWALRADFEVEYDNDAEQLIQFLEIKEDEPEESKQMKERILMIYADRLQERNRRKTFALQRGLLNYKRIMNLDKRKPEYARDIYKKYRCLARFGTAEDFEEFVSGLVEEERIRRRIKQLELYRANGIRNIADGERFEVELRKREIEKQRRREREKTILQQAAKVASAKSRRAEAFRSNPKVRNFSDINQMPGVELLTHKERDLCQALRIAPSHFQMMKDSMIRESFNSGFLPIEQARRMFKIDIFKIEKVYEFLSRCKFINNSPLAPSSSSSSAAGASSSSSSSSEMVDVSSAPQQQVINGEVPKVEAAAQSTPMEA